MRIVFMGTPAFAATILQEIANQHEVVAVYTRPDAVRGRGNALLASPVKQAAESLGVPVFTPKSLKNEEEQLRLNAFHADAFVVAAYGMLLPEEVLQMPRYGSLNAHASLLPRWRGAAPVERAILEGDEEVGVCAMHLDLELDAGPYCACRSIPVEHRSAEELLDDLALLGAEVLLSGLAQFEAGRMLWVDQDASQVTYARKLEKAELNIASDDSVVMADRKVRASSDAHPCKCVIAEKTVAILAAQNYAPDQCPAGDVPDKTLAFRGKRLYMGMKDGVLELLRVKPEGKKEMDAKAYAAGIQHIKSGEVYWRSLS